MRKATATKVRSEGWTAAELVSDDKLSPNRCNAYPHTDGLNRSPEWDQIPLMAALDPTGYAAWRQRTTDGILAEVPLPKGKKNPPKSIRNKLAKALIPYPDDLLACLQKDTAWWKQHRWSQPPGSRQVLYWRRRDALEVGMPSLLRRATAVPVTPMLVALTTPSGNKSALPPCSRTLPQAELFHRAIVGRAAKGQRVFCPELTGREKNGKPLSDGHRHAHILPVDLDADGRIDHIIVYAPMGLGDVAQLAIRSLKRTGTKGRVGDLQIALAGSGDIGALRLLPAPLDQEITKLLGSPEGGRVWVSVTPFVPPRFLKRRGANTLAGQINAELTSRNLSPVEQVEVLPWSDERLAMRHFARRRQRGGEPPPVDIGFAIRLRFSEPVVGPLTLGYASHFGLGLFCSEDIT